MAVVHTKTKHLNPKHQQNVKATVTPTSVELIQMSQSLDALGWTKVFNDVQNRIPVPGLAKSAENAQHCS